VGVADIDGKERHQGSERVLVEAVPHGQIDVGAQASGRTLRGKGSDDRDAAVAPGQGGVRPGRPTGGLQGLLANTGPARAANAAGSSCSVTPKTGANDEGVAPW